MSFVAINLLTVPPGGGALLEERFGARAGSVEQAPGFERFELLRPADPPGSPDQPGEQYLVYTRWRSRSDFEAWTASRSFDRGHAQASGRPEGAPAAATGSTIWAFETAQVADPA